MSIESWKAEFYPVSAFDIAKGRATDVELVEHSLNKWKGLLPENLKRHGVSLDTLYKFVHNVFDPHRVWIDSGSCALCVKYRPKSSGCTECPLAMSRNRTPCDARTPEENISPWYEFSSTGRTDRMIAALEKALAFAKEQAK